MTSQQVEKRFETLLRRVEPALRNEMRRQAARAVQQSRLLMGLEIYSKPEDVSPATGKKKWVRTGQLLREERLEEKSGSEFLLVNRTVYAEPRHEANKPGRRQINPLRTAHWRDDLLKGLEVSLPAGMERELLRLLRTEAR